MARHFKNWLTAYAAYTSDSESPPDFHFWTGVWTIAGALRRRVWIDMRKFQWTPNFYIVLVGPPGIVSKSTTARTGEFLLMKVDGIKFGPPSITWQKLTDNLSLAVEHMKYTDPAGKDIYIPMSCLSISVSELGTFFKMEDTSLVDVLVDLWDGQLSTWGHATKTSGQVDIKNPWINIIGCTTPTWLKANFPEKLIGGGLTSRMVFVFGDKKIKLVPYPDEQIAGADYYALQTKLIEDLKEIALMQGEITLSRDARIWGKAWYEDHWTKPRPGHMASERYGGYVARKQTLLHKIAIVLSAAESNALVIEKIHMEMALKLLESTEPHMLRVFESIGVHEEANHVHEILPFLKAHGIMTPDELWARVMNLMSQKEFNEAIHSAHRGGLVEVATDANGKRGIQISKPKAQP